jgi:hypothetical protein
MKVTRPTPGIGAEVIGADLRDPVDAGTRRAPNAALPDALERKIEGMKTVNAFKGSAATC